MSVGNIRKMWPELDEIIICTALDLKASGVQTGTAFPGSRRARRMREARIERVIGPAARANRKLCAQVSAGKPTFRARNQIAAVPRSEVLHHGPPAWHPRHTVWCCTRRGVS